MTMAMYRFVELFILLLICSIKILLSVAYLHDDDKCDALADLHCLEDKIFSQNGEDGILIALLDIIGIKSRYYVEFGVEDGSECNSRVLREVYSFDGLMMDGGNENLAVNLRKEFITERNVLDLFAKYSVPKDLDMLSVDIDMFDYWVLTRILRDGAYRPRIIIVETNPTLCLNQKLTAHSYAKVNSVPLTVIHPNMTQQEVWDLSRYSGANPLAFRLLGDKFGYEMVYCERCGVNCFLVLRDELPEACRSSSSSSRSSSMSTRVFQPMSPYPCFGTSRTGGAYPGHEYDPSSRSAVRIDQKLLIDITAGNITVSAIESSMQACPSVDVDDYDHYSFDSLCDIAVPLQFYRAIAGATKAAALSIEGAQGASSVSTPRSGIIVVNSMFEWIRELMSEGKYEGVYTTLDRFLTEEFRETVGGVVCISNHPSEYACSVESAALYDLGLSLLALGGRCDEAVASFRLASERNKREEKYRVMSSLAEKLCTTAARAATAATAATAAVVNSEGRRGEEERQEVEDRSEEEESSENVPGTSKAAAKKEVLLIEDSQLLGYTEIQFEIRLPTGESTSHAIGATVCQNTSHVAEQFREAYGLLQSEGKVIASVLFDQMKAAYFDQTIFNLLLPLVVLGTPPGVPPGVQWRSPVIMSSTHTILAPVVDSSQKEEEENVPLLHGGANIDVTGSRDSSSSDSSNGDVLAGAGSSVYRLSAAIIENSEIFQRLSSLCALHVVPTS